MAHGASFLWGGVEPNTIANMGFLHLCGYLHMSKFAGPKTHVNNYLKEIRRRKNEEWARKVIPLALDLMGTKAPIYANFELVVKSPSPLGYEIDL